MLNIIVGELSNISFGSLRVKYEIARCVTFYDFAISFASTTKGISSGDEHQK